MAVTEKYIDLGIKVGFVAGGILLLKHLFKNADKDSAEDKVLTDNNAALADTLFSLLHGYGGGWLSVFENVDEAAVIKWATNPMDFNKVRTYYKKLTKGKDLLDEVKIPLTASEYAQFLGNIKKSNTTTQTTQTTTKKTTPVVIKVIARKSGVITKVSAQIAFKNPKTGKYQLTEKAETIFFDDNKEIGEFLAETPIYMAQYKTKINYNFVKGTGKLTGKYLFVLKSQSVIK